MPEAEGVNEETAAKPASAEQAGVVENAAPDPNARRNVRTVDVLVEISDAERVFRGRQIVQKLHELRESERELERVEETFKADKKVRTAAIEAARGEIHALGDVLRSGKENRPVEVHDVWLGEEQRVVTRRIDTGEDVATQTMTRPQIEQWRKQQEAARQRTMFPGAEPKPIAEEGGGAQ